jgi:uncharacterized protein
LRRYRRTASALRKKQADTTIACLNVAATRLPFVRPLLQLTTFITGLDMATREQIGFIRDARAGSASAQLMLGKHYLFGGAGLQKNAATALYWLRRAATHNVEQAWLLIGEHVPFDVALRAPDPMQLCAWYERACDAGVAQAGLVWAKLLLTRPDCGIDRERHDKLLAALRTAADAGIVDAQWLLAQELKKASRAAPALDTAAGKAIAQQALEWATRAAANGVPQAQHALADRAWAMQDTQAFLRWSAPVVQQILQRAPVRSASVALSEQEATLLARHARALQESAGHDAREVERCRELAAQAGNKDAQFALGMWYANMDERDCRRLRSSRKSSYRKAIHWLTLAGEQGIAKAWHALYTIHVRPNTGLTQHSAADVQRFLERAAERGHAAAQLALGRQCWRGRRGNEGNDVRAAWWLQKAAAQGNDEALALLRTVASCATPAPWADAARAQFTHDMPATHPFLAARIELAALFGLSLPEALLLDMNAADGGHCLVVDIRAMHARSKRRLILIESGAERLALTRITRRFANIDCGTGGPEGNYRQRLYLFNKYFPASSNARNAIRKSASGCVQAISASV